MKINLKNNNIRSASINHGEVKVWRVYISVRRSILIFTYYGNTDGTFWAISNIFGLIFPTSWFPRLRLK